MILSDINETNTLFGTTASSFDSGGTGAQTSQPGAIIKDTATATETAASCNSAARKSLI